MAFKVKLRRDTPANFAAANPVLEHGEMGYEYTAPGIGNLKIGDGFTAWNDLPYFYEGLLDITTWPSIHIGSDTPIDPRAQLWLVPGEVKPPDTVAPSSGTISINSGAAYATEQNVVLILSAADNEGVTEMMVGNDLAFTGGVWEEFSTTKAWSLSSGDGLKTVYVKFRDAAHNSSPPYSATITLDSVAPTATINGTPASPTSNNYATLTVAGADVVAYKYKLDGGAWGAETPVATPITLVGLSNASHTVSVIGRDTAGNWQSTSSPSTTTWTVDTNLPDTSAPVTSCDLAAGTYNSTHIIHLTPDETATTYYTTDGSTPVYPPSGATQTYVPANGIQLSEGTTTLKFFSRDTAGNPESVKTLIFTIDTTPPVTSIDVSGGTYGSAQVIHLSTEGGATIFYSTDGSTPSVVYSGAINISGNTTLKFFARDAAGNNESVHTEVYTIVAVPAAPTGIVATVGDTQNSINWDTVVNADSYNVKWGTSSGNYPNTVTGASKPFVHTGLTNGTQYFYVVVAVNAGGTSPDSSQVGAVPDAPPVFSSQPSVHSGYPTTSSVVLDYGTSDAGSNHYRLDYSLNNGANWTTGLVSDETPGAGKSCTISGLTEGTSYTIRLRLHPLSGNLTEVASNSVAVQTLSHSLTKSTTGKIAFSSFATDSVLTPFTAGTGSNQVAGGELLLTAGSSNPGQAIYTFSPSAKAKPLYVTVMIKLKESTSIALIDFISGANKYTMFPKYQSNGVYLQKNGSNLTNTTDSYTSTSYDNYGLKVHSGGLAIYRNGNLVLYHTDNTIDNFGSFILTGTSGNNGQGAYYDDVAVNASHIITCSGLPSGWKLRIASKVATESGGTASVDCTGLMFPQSAVEVLNGSDAVQKTLTLTNDVWGGDAYTFT